MGLALVLSPLAFDQAHGLQQVALVNVATSPAITGLSPEEATAGSPTFRLIVTGGGCLYGARAFVTLERRPD